MLDERIRECERPVLCVCRSSLINMNHVLNASARRIGLQVPQSIGGASAKAKPAMNTAGVVLKERNLPGDGRGSQSIIRRQTYMIRLGCCSSKGRGRNEQIPS